jgi:hypothetical protein
MAIEGKPSIAPAKMRRPGDIEHDHEVNRGDLSASAQ